MGGARRFRSSGVRPARVTTASSMGAQGGFGLGPRGSAVAWAASPRRATRHRGGAREQAGSGMDSRSARSGASLRSRSSDSGYGANYRTGWRLLGLFR